MSTNGKYRPYLIALFAALGLFASYSCVTSALADDAAPITKGPEVSTVGSGPYLGPLPEELSKLAEMDAATAESSSSDKEPAAATMTAGGLNILTTEEQAKLAALLAVPVTPLESTMPKLGIMEIPKDGIPELTQQEREKHAIELATPQPTRKSGQ
jgi:hypothetical protein